MTADSYMAINMLKLPNFNILKTWLNIENDNLNKWYEFYVKKLR